MSSTSPAGSFATAAELTAALTRFEREGRRGLVATGRYRCRYVVWGESPESPLVFVHGLSDQTRAFAMVMAHLVGAGFRCIGYELPNGHGDGANLGMYRHPDLVADLLALLDHLRIDRADLIGSSFGTTVALRALATHPARFRRAVLKGAFARRPLRRIERGLARLGRYWPWRMGDLPIRRGELARVEGAAFAGCDPAVFDFLLQCSGEAPIRAVALRTLMLDRLDLRSLLPQIRQPVLLVAGDQDGIVPRWCEAEVEAGLKDVRRVELAPCGHYPQYTVPGPTAAVITAFLRGEPRDLPREWRVSANPP